MKSRHISKVIGYFTVRNILYIAIMYQVFVAVFVGAIGLKGMQEQLSGFDKTYSSRIVPLNGLKKLSDIYSIELTQTIQKVRDGTLSPFKAAENLQKSFNSIESSWLTYLNEDLSPGELSIHQQLVPQVNEGHEMVKGIIGQLEKGATMELHFIAETRLYPAMNSIVGGIGQLIEALLHETESDYLHQQQSFKQAVKMVIGVILFAALTSAGAGLYFARAILMRPLKSAMYFARDIANGHLNTHINVSRQDEIGELVQALQQMQKGLRNMVQTIQSNSEKIASSSHDLASTTDAISEATSQQSEEALKINNSIHHLSSSIENINLLTNEARNISAHSGELSSQGEQIFEAVITDIQLISNITGKASSSVLELGEHSNQVSQVVSVIHDVAEQTNLLALNAAIEAARAGDQGRGFSVVADEVRQLAERTATSTKEITSKVNLITEGTATVVKIMKQQGEQVQESVNQAGEAGKAIRNIHLASTEVVSRIELIVTALEEQTRTNTEVTKSIEKITHMTNQNSQSSSEVATSSRRLAELSTALRKTVQQFVL